MMDDQMTHAEAMSKLAELAEENDRLRGLLGKLVEQLGTRDRGDGNAPGHHHDIPGVWDRDNGVLAGKKCAWCALWAEAKAAVPNELAKGRAESASSD